jgi:arabinofuranan 3-O-arabinosyltransferase
VVDLTRFSKPAAEALARLPRSPTAWVLALLLLVSFLQRPGRATFDTKLDLAVNPAGFLARALHLWNPQSSSGELQNQAYGYFFPIGPFFTACQWLGISPWIAQRLWCGLLLCVAFGGALVLARALRIGSEPARYAGALAYALAPRMLTEIGPVSAEMLPAVMLPWVMVPLVKAGRIGSPRRAAGLSALAVLCMGGVNGAMVVMALVLPGLWLLTRRWTREHLKLALWWCGGVIAACLWWILPLLLFGEYSMPFVDYVESASNTTAPNSLFEVLRGTNQWVAYVVQGTPFWPSGFVLVDNPVLMLGTGLVAAVGLVGLVRPGLPERRFLTLGVLAGVTLLTIGYVGTFDSPVSGVVRPLLDGALAPFRNVHKLEPGLRLPLILGFMHAITGRLPGLAPGGSVRWAVRSRVAIGALLVLVISAPAWMFTLRPGPGWSEIPDHWRSALAWLGDADQRSRTLLLPSSGFGEYTWGRTVDEPAQALASAPWAVRSQIPFGSEGNTRVMDTVEEALANGRGSPGLADFLARAGFRYVLLRNDIDRVTTGSPPLSVMRAGLSGSPGLDRVATFGPDVKAADHPMVDLVDWAAPAVPALEIFEVKRPVATVSAVLMDDVPTVAGGPESLLPLLESGLLRGAAPAVLAGDGGAPPENQWLVTDGLRYRERNVGRVRDNLSATMTAGEQPRQGRPAVDLLPFEGVEHQTVAAYRGIRGVSASSSAAFADTFGPTDPSWLPFAAVDGDPATAWRSSSFSGPAGQWLEVALDTPQAVTEVTLRLVDDIRVGWPVTKIRITTDAGSVDHDVVRKFGPQTFATAPGLTGRLRVSVLSVAANRVEGGVGISELTIAGVAPVRALRVPAGYYGPRTGFAFTRGTVPRDACLTDAGGRRCSAGLVRFGEEPAGIHRLFSTTVQTTYQVRGTVLAARQGVSVLAPGVEVSSSTQLGGDPAAGPLAAVDGDQNTSWIAEVTDLRPTLRLAWNGPRKITGIRLATNVHSGGAQPSTVSLVTPAGTESVELDAEGKASVNLTTDRIEIAVTATAGLDGDDAPGRRGGPPGISELTLTGLDGVIQPVRPDAPFTIPCGAGPRVVIAGTAYDTSVSGSLRDFVQHRPLAIGTCEDLAEGIVLEAGDHEVRTEQSKSFLVQDLWLIPAGLVPDEPRQRSIAVRQWDVTHRRIEVDAGAAALLRVPENASDGWVATVDGRQLERTRVDGWQQAWVLPAGDRVVVQLDFLPDSSYRNRLLLGGLAVLGLIVGTALPMRRREQRKVEPGGRIWVPIVLIGLLAVLGGMLPVVLLLGCLLLRHVWRLAPAVLAASGVVAATGIAVTGRLLGHGQEWAYGAGAQIALLVSLAAVVSVCVDWLDRRGAVQ